MKLKRILAYIIDWNLSGLPAILYSLIFAEIVKSQGANAVYILLFLFFVLSFPVIFVLRDVIFRGRSISKRIFRLYIVDNSTNETPSKLKLIIRNLFFFIYPIDAIMLIITNRSIGDMIADTSVIQK